MTDDSDETNAKSCMPSLSDETPKANAEGRAFTEFYHDRFLKRLATFHRQAISNRRWYIICTCIMIGATALVTALSGPGVFGNDVGALTWLRFAASLALSVSSMLVSTFKFKDHWLRHRSYAERLHDEEHAMNNKLFKYAAGPSEDKDLTEARGRRLFMESVIAILREERMSWIATVQSKSSDTGVCSPSSCSV